MTRKVFLLAALLSASAAAATIEVGRNVHVSAARAKRGAGTPSSRWCYYTRFSASLDGGDAWLPSVRVSEAPNAPKTNSSFGITGGHTAGLAADKSGTFHALFVDDRTGTQQVWIAPITVKK